MTSTSHWQQANLADIKGRVAFVRDLPDGTIHECPGSLHNLQVWKVGDRLELVFLGGQSTEVISDLEYDRPLHLFAGFTQAMMLGLLWREKPSRVYVIGFGAGRVPMLLHHYFPKVSVESTDIDPDVVDVAREFFGIEPDDRQIVAVQDGRAYLEERSADTRYDIIMVDAFRGVGSSPVELGTREFYDACRAHLADRGVVVVNLLTSDELFLEKVNTLAQCFAAVHCVPVSEDGAAVFFASDAGDVTRARFIERAGAIEKRHRFSFPFAAHARLLRKVDETPQIGTRLRHAAELTDSSAQRVLRHQRALRSKYASSEPFDALGEVGEPGSVAPARVAGSKVGRNAPCPCGSGRKHKQCCLKGAP